MRWAMQDPQPALAAGLDPAELQSTVVPFSLDKRLEGKRLIYSGRYSSLHRSAALCVRGCLPWRRTRSAMWMTRGPAV